MPLNAAIWSLPRRDPEEMLLERRDDAVAIEVEHPLARMNDEKRLGGTHRFENLPRCF